MFSAKIRRRLSFASAAPWNAWALVACLLVAFGALNAAPDFDKMQSLALQRYGSKGAETVLAWRRMIEESRDLPDAEKLTQVNNFFQAFCFILVAFAEIIKHRVGGTAVSTAQYVEKAVVYTAVDAGEVQ